jgi:hypothetical protein
MDVHARTSDTVIQDTATSEMVASSSLDRSQPSPIVPALSLGGLAIGLLVIAWIAVLALLAAQRLG